MSNIIKGDIIYYPIFNIYGICVHICNDNNSINLIGTNNVIYEHINMVNINKLHNV